MQNIIMSAAMGYFTYGLKNEFETAVVNQPSVFEPLKFYCSHFSDIYRSVNYTESSAK